MEICEHHSNRLFAYIFVDTVYNVHTRVLHVCGNGDITAVSGVSLARVEMNSSHSTAEMRRCYSTREYRANGNSFAGINAGVVRLLTRNSAIANRRHDTFMQYAMTWPTRLKHACPHICYHARFGRSTSKDVGLSWGRIPIIGEHRGLASWDRAWLTL